MAIQSFPKIGSEKPSTLILGTMPSVKSLEADFYYAHPRNAFWPIIQRYCGKKLISQQEKIEALANNQIAVWDVLSTCERQGSLDSAIKQPIANNFSDFFLQYPNIRFVLFNGQAAAKLFNKEVVQKQVIPQHLTFYTLTSTSPANAQFSLEDKWLLWREVLYKIR